MNKSEVKEPFCYFKTGLFSHASGGIFLNNNDSFKK